MAAGSKCCEYGENRSSAILADSGLSVQAFPPLQVEDPLDTNCVYDRDNTPETTICIVPPSNCSPEFLFTADLHLFPKDTRLQGEKNENKTKKALNTRCFFCRSLADIDLFCYPCDMPKKSELVSRCFECSQGLTFTWWGCCGFCF